MVSAVRRQKAPPPPPKVEEKKAATEAEQLQQLLGVLGTKLETAWKDAVNPPAGAAQTNPLLRFLSSFINSPMPQAAAVAEAAAKADQVKISARQATAKDSLGFSVSDPKAKTTEKTDPAGAKPQGRIVEPSKDFAETVARLNEARTDGIVTKAEAGAVIYSMAKEMRLAKAAGVPHDEISKTIAAMFGAFRSGVALGDDLLPVADGLGSALGMIGLMGDNPAAYEQLALGLLGGRPPEPVKVPAPPPGAGAAAAGELPPWTDTLILSFSQGFSPQEADWMRTLAYDMSQKGQTLEGAGPTRYPALLAEKLGEHLATGVAVSPAFAERFVKLTAEGNRPDLGRKYAGKANVDPSLAPPPPNRGGQEGAGGVPLVFGADGQPVAQPEEPQRQPPPPGMPIGNDQVTREARLRQERLRRAEERRRDEANAGGGGGGNEPQVRMTQEQQRETLVNLQRLDAEKQRLQQQLQVEDQHRRDDEARRRR